MRFSWTSKMVVRSAALTAVVTLGAAACSTPDPDPVASGDGRPVFVGLQGAAPTMLRENRSCDAVLDDFQSFAPAVLRGRSTDFGVATTEAAVAADGSAGTFQAAPAPGDGSRVASGGETSDTNTQEKGIDEPDVVETDGDFVYLVDGDQLTILDGATAAVVGRTTLAGHGAQLLLSGDRILAVTGGGGYGIAEPGPVVSEDVVVAEPEPLPVDPAEPLPVDRAEPLPVDPIPVEPEPLPVEPEPRPIELPSFPAGTVLQLVDVSDRGAPAIVETTEIDGQHISTRVVDGVARVVISSYPQPRPLATVGAVDPGTSGDLDDVVGAQIAATEIGDWLPAFRTTAMTEEGPSADPVEGPIVDCEDVLVPEVNAGVAETSVLRVDFTDGFDPADTTTIVAEANTVYASASTLYLAATRYVDPATLGDVSSDDWSTAIHAFDLGSDGAAAHLGAGEVPGSTLNQYSLSEFAGHLRIATTEGTPWDDRSVSESAVRVLRLDGDRLVEVGVVGGLGRTETIQSVRFMGPVGYVVTFRQTDPLYVIDLSNPTAPTAVGELKIPGFSSYLHPIGEGRLVGIGRDADLEGRDQGFLVSLFDVSDPTAPTQVATYTERDANSAAGFDPKAFLWWAPESVVVVPIERYGNQLEASPDGYTAGILVLDVADDAITERATITVDGRYPYRSLVVQGTLWSLFDGAVLTSSFDDPAEGTLHPLR